jgi:hypothetical protein
MCANPQTARESLMYKVSSCSLRPIRQNAFLFSTPRYLRADACFAESVSKTRGLTETSSWISQKESFYEQD